MTDKLLIVGSSKPTPVVTCDTTRAMAECQASSVAALNVIRSDTSDSEYRSDDDNNVSEDQDCEVVLSADQDCSEANNEDRNSSSSSSAVSLLSVLKAPRLSDLCRKRKVAINPPPKGKCSFKWEIVL